MGKDQGPSDQKKPKPINTYLKYSGLAFQLLITIGVAGWLGHKLDNYLEIRFPLFMLLLGLGAFGGTIYQLYRSINQE